MASLTATAGTASAQLNWTAVASATGYNNLRNDASCASGSTIIATVPGTTFTDTGLANGFTVYYAVQPISANTACDGRLSNCQAVTPQPFAGAVKLDASTYGCASVVNVSVTDANIAGTTTTVNVASTTEPAGETITLTRVSSGSSHYAGTLSTTGNAPAVDGLLSVVNAATITATYLDTSDGQGGVNLTRQTTATTDCAGPIITNVASSLVTDQSARVTWNTNEAATSVVRYGLTPPLGSNAALPARVVGHTVDLTGLAPCSTYLYAVESADAVANVAQDDNGGAYHAFTTGQERLTASQIWARLKDEQRAALTATCHLTPPAKAPIGTDDEILDALRARTLADRRNLLDAVPQRFGRALEEAARLASPEAVRVVLPSAIIKTPAELDQWLAGTRKLVEEKLKDGPVIL